MPTLAYETWRDWWLYWVGLLHSRYFQSFSRDLSVCLSMYVCLHIFAAANGCSSRFRLAYSVSTNSVRPDCGCTSYISQRIVRVSLICLPNPHDNLPPPRCEDISPISAYEIKQRQPKRLPAFHYISSMVNVFLLPCIGVAGSAVVQAPGGGSLHPWWKWKTTPVTGWRLYSSCDVSEMNALKNEDAQERWVWCVWPCLSSLMKVHERAVSWVREAGCSAVLTL